MRLPPPDPSLRDEVVLLRAWRPSDAPAVAAACQDPEIPRWTTVQMPYREDDARAWLEGVVAIDERGEAVHWAVVDASAHELAGSLTLWLVKPGVAEFGYWTVAERRGRGYMTRALRLGAAWAQEVVGLPRLQLGTLPGNGASERVAEKVGFKREGVLRAYLDQRGERRDVTMWSLLPGERR